jgi:hypothetical protein
MFSTNDKKKYEYFILMSDIRNIASEVFPRMKSNTAVAYIRSKKIIPVNEVMPKKTRRIT